MQLHDEHLRRRHGECARCSNGRTTAGRRRRDARSRQRRPERDSVRIWKRGACGRTIVGHAWSITDAFGVGITNPTPDTAVVVAPSTGSFTVRLTVTDDVGREDTADVVVTASSALTAVPAAADTPACPQPIAAPPAVSVTVTPDAASVAAPGGTQTFVATLSNAQDTSVVWQVGGIAGGNTTLGTISAAGVYTAPAIVPSPATVTVSAVSNQDLDRSAAAQVTLTFTPAASDGGGGGGGGAALDLLLLLCACDRRSTANMRPAFAALPPSMAVGQLLTEPRKSLIQGADRAARGASRAWRRRVTGQARIGQNPSAGPAFRSQPWASQTVLLVRVRRA